jgi:hypothetical protein
MDLADVPGLGVSFNRDVFRELCLDEIDWI